ncbi:hypothetical protein QBC33DRAFT_197524 [Phialemonium atrogriseum]|uniref:Uncharacterized protein n=1 Tax=Phialemonium atrogriseum TaxID=1093897 RepID=A0AAJ0FDA0_9PEZI|nr:uncharacterized protein QBC33DRAFT_197524 [Phialemonium atrogriseum]KAK1764381.1 hypothetical protein QBC33DRAFT_197524 [Phialemonium atrogriseum]
MVGGNELISGMGLVVAGIEVIPAKFHHPELRPSYEEATRLNQLASQILECAKAVQDALTECAAAWAPDVPKKADEHMSIARLALQTAARGEVRGLGLKKNLGIIFKGPQGSTLDSPQPKTRKTRRAERCKALRSMAPGAILAWAVSLPCSLWEDVGQHIFNNLLKQMADKALSGLPANALDTIRSLGQEEPLEGVVEYKNFVQGASNRQAM